MSDLIARDTHRLSTNYGEDHGIPLWLYLISSDEHNALLDAGIASTPAHLGVELAGADVTLADITLLVNSHAHADHMGGDAVVIARSKAKLAAPLREVEWIEERDRYVSELWEAYPGVLEIDSEKGRQIREMCGPNARVDILLRDGDHLSVGTHELEVIITGGHSPAHLVLLDLETRVLFTFDFVQGHGTARLDGPTLLAPLYCDRRQYLSGLLRLLEEDFELLAPSHGKVLDKREGRRHIEDSIAFVHELDQYVLNLLTEEGAISTREVASRIGFEFGNFGGVNLQTASLAEAHLRDLGRLGRAEPHWSLRLAGKSRDTEAGVVLR